MAPRPDEPLRKVTLNLYDTDVDSLAAYYGRGWSEQVRQVVRAHIRAITGYQKLRRTLGDLE